jgi:hypothetical protein
MVKARSSACRRTLRLSQISTMFPPGSWRRAAASRSRYSVHANAFFPILRPPWQWPPRCSYPRPDLPLPYFDGAVVPPGRAAGAQLAAPAPAGQQEPGPRDRAPGPEPAGYRVPDPGERPPLVLPARRRADAQPDQLPPPAALGGQPAALRIPHIPCIPPKTEPVSPTDITR